MSNQHRRPRGRSTPDVSHHQQHEHLLLEELRTIFRLELVDPQLDGVTIVAVHLSGDGSSARVAWASRQATPGVEEAMTRAQGFVRARLAASLNWKRTPRLSFVPLGVLAGGAP